MKNYIVPFIFSSILYGYTYVLGAWTFRSGGDWYLTVIESPSILAATIIHLGIIFIVVVIILDTLINRMKHPKLIYTLCGFLFIYEITETFSQLLNNFSHPMLLNILGMRALFTILLIMGTVTYYQQVTLNKCRHQI